MTLEEALREANEACPCRIYADTIDGDACSADPCKCFTVDASGIDCLWPGHARIALVAKVAAAEEHAYCMGCGAQGPPASGDECDRLLELRREVEEAKIPLDTPSPSRHT